jgi:hypothetical protein
MSDAVASSVGTAVAAGVGVGRTGVGVGGAEATNPHALNEAQTAKAAAAASQRGRTR